MSEIVEYAGGLVRVYVGRGSVKVLPGEEAVKTSFFGATKTGKQGQYILLPGQTLVVVNKKPKPINSTVMANLNDKFPFSFNLVGNYIAKDVEKIVNESPESPMASLENLMNSEAIEIVYGVADLSSLLKDRGTFEKKVEAYAQGVLESWGYGIQSLKAKMNVPEVLAQPVIDEASTRAQISVLKAKKDLATAQGELGLTETAYAAQSRALEINIVGTAELDNLQRYLDMKSVYLGGLLEKIAKEYKEDAPAVVYAAFKETFGAGNPVADAVYKSIATQIGMKSEARGAAAAAKVIGTTPTATYFGNLLSKSNLMAIATPTMLDNLSNYLDASLQKKVYDS